MKKIALLCLTTCLILTNLTVGYTQDADLDALRASDINADGVINILDLTLVATDLGTTPAADQTPNTDVNGDGTVNILDLTLVASHLGKTVSPPVMFISANPAIGSQLTINDTITLTFDNMPEDVTVSTGIATVTDKTVSILGPFDAGALALTITWTDGTQTLDYTIRTPVAFVSANPAANSKLTVDDTITLTFDNMPEDVTVSTGVATIADKTVEITGPFDAGALALTVTWADGTQTLNYTIKPLATFVSADPAANSKLAVDDTITLTFDNPPEDVKASTGDATVADKTVEITGPFDPGALALTVTWADGTQTLNYTIRPLATFVSANPAVRSQIAVDDTITLTFDNPPEDVTVSTGTARTIGKRVRITGPFDVGPLALTVVWADGGVKTLNYTVRAPDTDAPKITSGSVNDGDKDVDPEALKRIEVTFNETVTGNIALRTVAGVDAGWLGKVSGKKGTLELVRGKELDNEKTYVIAGKVSDTAGNSTDINIRFTTAPKTSGIPFTVTDATFNSLVLNSEIPVVVEFVKDG
ncbi:hypothetical protein C6500_04465 [Candidatus Poribacteria bacterium]|nr:MAG: hypothetical protein C6500_04465 [Candidatus Poribacteria bacterium]